jgi:hypothetical protein
MKYLGIIIAVLFILQSCGEKVPDQPQQNSTSIDQVSLNPKYVHGTYQFKGKVTTEMGAFVSVHNFTGKTTSDTFDIEWGNDASSHSSKGSLSISPKGGLVHITDGMEESIADPAMAVAAATGISGGCAHLMYGLWIGDKRSVFQSNKADVQVRDHGRIVVTGKTQNDARSFEVIVDNGMLSSVSDIFDPKINPKKNEAPQMSDDDIKELLKKMNRPVNGEEIAKMRDNLAQANAVLKKSKDPVKTTTVVTFTGLDN